MSPLPVPVHLPELQIKTLPSWLHENKTKIPITNVCGEDNYQINTEA